MPHIEIKYTDNLDFDIRKVFKNVEQVINEHDASAEECKSRAYPCSQYSYPHILTTISLLTKPHRDQHFTKKLSVDIEAAIKDQLKQSAYFSLNIEYNLPYYTTNSHIVDGGALPKRLE